MVNVNLLILNCNKPHHTQFRTKVNLPSAIAICYSNNTILSITVTKFLGVIIGSSLTWKEHVFLLVPELSEACYLMRVIDPIMSVEFLKSVYNSCFHSHVTYRVILRGDSSYSLQIVTLQKRIIRIMSGLRSRDCCRNGFKNLKILPLQSQFIFYLLFVVNNTELYNTVAQIRDINTRCTFVIYQPHSNLTSYQKGAYYFGIRLFNVLPLYIKMLAHNAEQFRLA